MPIQGRNLRCTVYYRDRSLAAWCGSVAVGFMAVSLLAMVLNACADPFEDAQLGYPDVGGYEDVVLDLPFAEGYQSYCTQGAGGSYSHQSSSTDEDLDFDTPNGESDLVYAPIGGVASVHTESASKNFGYHVNIDRGNNTYVVVAHLSEIFVEDGVEVAAGQLLGYEGCTGSCTGDHVHLGLHSGLATSMAEFGASQSVSYYLDDVTAGELGVTVTSDEVICSDRGSGHIYASRLPVGSWHPNGSLVKTPDMPTVYRIDGETRRWIVTEDVFWEMGYDFRDVALISEAELDCYDVGSTITSAEEAPASYASGDGLTILREGDLVKEESTSDVYLVSDGVAMPIVSYDVLLKLGWGSRTIQTVADGELSEIIGRVGSCGAGYHCLDEAAIMTCATGESIERGEGGSEDGGTEETETGENEGDSGSEEPSEESEEARDPSSMLEGEIEDGELGLVFLPPAGEVEESELVMRSVGILAVGDSDGVLVYTTDSFEPGDQFDFAIRYSDGMGDSYACELDGGSVIERGTLYAVYGEIELEVEPLNEAYSERGCYHRLNVPGETVTDSEVEICYEPGGTMLGGELYLDGGFFTHWDTDPADTASSGDSQMCATVEAVSSEEVKMNAWFMESATVEWAAYNNWCTSIDWQGSLTVDGTSVVAETRPWSDVAWASDPCNTGGDAYFTVP